ncbi:hypothetical protein CFP56_031017 [Quercus suber]|uniref:Uncharacterized protein n=1 Tax=Quercus suber TaxID=58331 RepID=A0AAW0LTC5_QUESU
MHRTSVDSFVRGKSGRILGKYHTNDKNADQTSAETLLIMPLHTTILTSTQPLLMIPINTRRYIEDNRWPEQRSRVDIDIHGISIMPPNQKNKAAGQYQIIHSNSS